MPTSTTVHTVCASIGARDSIYWMPSPIHGQIASLSFPLPLKKIKPSVDAIVLHIKFSGEKVSPNFGVPNIFISFNFIHRYIFNKPTEYKKNS